MVVPMMFREEDFTEQAREAIGASYDVVRRFRHPQWDVEHVMLALLENAKSVPVQTASEEERHRRAVMEALKKQFSPEFLNRIDEFIVFHQLTRAELFRIVDLMVNQVRNRLSDREIGIELTEGAKAWLVEQGYDAVYGARPLRRTIERHVENEVAKRLLGGEFNDGDTVLVDESAGQLTLERQEAPAMEPVAASSA